MSAGLISQQITGWCLRNWNFPLSDHTHICQKDSARHGACHRCQCGDELVGEAGSEATPKDDLRGAS